MGVVSLALVADGTLSPAHFHVPLWVVCACAASMDLGTYAGGWRIIRTVGTRIIRMDRAQGTVIQATGALVILLSSALGFPLSSTYVISAGVVDSGAAKSLSVVRWGVANSIAIAWLLTLPVAGLFGAAVYALSALFGSGTTGPVVIAVIAVALLCGGLAGRRRRMTAAAAAALA
jgi:inorganic phosphate transporter, PiT family